MVGSVSSTELFSSPWGSALSGVVGAVLSVFSSSLDADDAGASDCPCSGVPAAVAASCDVVVVAVSVVDSIDADEPLGASPPPNGGAPAVPD